MWWFEGARWRKAPAGEDSGALCGGASAGQGRWLKKGFGAAGIESAAVKAHPNLVSDGIGNRLVPARDFFLEKKQKRARCSGLPSRFILCRTCRAKAACLGGVSVCIPHAAGAAHASRNVRHA